MRFNLSIGLLVAAMALPQVAYAKCDLTLEAPGQARFEGGGGTGYESFEVARFEAGFSISVSNDGEESCDGLLSIQRMEGASGLGGPASATLDYAVTLPGSLATIVDDQIEIGRPPNAVAVSIPGGRTQIVNLALQIPPRQVVPSGGYSDTVLVRILDASEMSVVAEQSLELVTQVRSAMSVLLFDGNVGAASSVEAGTQNRRLDFGSLEEGEQASLTILVQSNDEYALRFSSTKGGALWHTVRGAADQIGYSASFGGRALDLASGEALVNGWSATGLGGVSQPLNVRIGQVGGARAGRYEDDIVITVLPMG